MKITLATAKLRSYCFPQADGAFAWRAVCPTCDTRGERRATKREASDDARLHNATVHPDALEEAARAAGRAA